MSVYNEIRIMVLRAGITIKMSMLLFCLELLTGCVGVSNSESVAVNPVGWGRSELKTVVFENRDTLSPRDIVLFVTHENDFSERSGSFTLDITTVTPDSLSYTEQLLFTDAVRQRCGNGYTVSSKIYRSHALLGSVGEYRFTIGHNEIIPLRGVRAVGVEVANIENGER